MLRKCVVVAVIAATVVLPQLAVAESADELSCLAAKERKTARFLRCVAACRWSPQTNRVPAGVGACEDTCRARHDAPLARLAQRPSCGSIEVASDVQLLPSTAGRDRLRCGAAIATNEARLYACNATCRHRADVNEANGKPFDKPRCDLGCRSRHEGAGERIAARTYCASSENEADTIDSERFASTAAVIQPTWSCAPPYETPTYTASKDDSVVFASVLEAAGYARPPNSSWVDVAAGNFCGGAEKELVLLKNAHSYFSVLRGPAPHVIGTDVSSGALSSISSSSHPWRAVAAGDLDGDGYDEIVAIRRVTATGVPDLVVAKASPTSCKLSTVLASKIIGGVNNSEWVDAAIGDFDGNGSKEIALLKAAHSHFIFVKFTAPSTLTVYLGTDLDSISNQPWKALAAGDLDDDGKDELIAGRLVSDRAGSTVLAYRWTGSSFKLLATSSFGISGNSNWASAAAGNFGGDGREAVVLVKNTHSNFAVLDYQGGSSLRVLSAKDLESVSGQPWRGIAATDWVRNDASHDELVAVRAATGNYRTDIFVHGNSFHRVSRDSGLDATKAQIGEHSGATMIDELLEWLADTHTNTYNWILRNPPNTTGYDGDYKELVEFLERTKNFCVDGQQLRVWVTLGSPNMSRECREEKDDERKCKCSMPTDSPLTASWNEMAYFSSTPNGEDCRDDGTEADSPPSWPSSCSNYCTDYTGWANLIGRLAQDYPHLVALGVDDFSHHIDRTFTPEYVAAMESRLRRQSPWLNFVPTFYYVEGSEFTGELWPDVIPTFDSVLFYFRNQSEGLGVCAEPKCPVSCWEEFGRDSGCCSYCLAGTCAEATVDNAPGEFDDMSRRLPTGRKLQAGVYFDGTTACGTPSAQYDFELLTLALGHPAIGGTTVYQTQNPADDVDKYHIVQHLYGSD
jgi:hypothetical protein